jgi:hypothetical protein
VAALQGSRLESNRPANGRFRPTTNPPSRNVLILSWMKAGCPSQSLQDAPLHRLGSRRPSAEYLVHPMSIWCLPQLIAGGDGSRLRLCPCNEIPPSRHTAIPAPAEPADFQRAFINHPSSPLLERHFSHSRRIYLYYPHLESTPRASSPSGPEHCTEIQPAPKQRPV